MMRIYFGLLAADGNWYSHIQALEGEELFESYKRTQKYTNIPHRLRGVVATGLRLVGEHRKAHVVEALKSGGSWLKCISSSIRRSPQSDKKVEVHDVHVHAV
jgi:hypothetical protein